MMSTHGDGISSVSVGPDPGDETPLLLQDQYQVIIQFLDKYSHDSLYFFSNIAFHPQYQTDCK